MKKLVIVSICLTLLLSFCQNETSKKTSNKKEEIALKKDSAVTAEKKDSVKPTASTDVSNIYNATASVLAGLKSSAGTLSNYMDSAAWKENANSIDSSWKRLERTRLVKMRNWRDKELSAINKNDKTLFYPFSGPDFLTAYTFFPDVDKYVMLGLEPMGRLPEINKMKGKDAEQYVKNFKTSLADIFNKSYFITQYMGRDLQNQKVNGTLPILSFFIKRTGNEITNITFVVKKDKDSIIEVPYDYKDKKNLPFGV
ncbi:MAG: hypothetical protein ABI388_06500, partial [Bacteroidia bacterium]